jgi:hypothetical protein
MVNKSSPGWQINAWRRWTELEAYAKFFEIPLFLCLHRQQSKRGSFSQSYVIDEELMMTIVSMKENPVTLILRGDGMIHPDIGVGEMHLPITRIPTREAGGIEHEQ